jgi:hypothetical protein
MVKPEGPWVGFGERTLDLRQLVGRGRPGRHEARIVA